MIYDKEEFRPKIINKSKKDTLKCKSGINIHLRTLCQIKIESETTEDVRIKSNTLITRDSTIPFCLRHSRMWKKIRIWNN